MSDGGDKDKVEAVVVLGSGPAGLTAALYTSRASLSPLVVEGSLAGGQLMNTTDIENFPGFESINGGELVGKMREQVAKMGARFVYGDVVEADLSSRPFTLKLQEGAPIKTKTLIIATGATAKWLGVPGEERLKTHGVSACATCDGAFFKRKDVVVVGGGDTAMEEAIFLTRFANSVVVLHRRESLRASKIMQDRARSNPKITFRLNTVVEEILGSKSVTGVRVRDVVTGAQEDLFVGGVFMAIGHEPNSTLFRSQLKCDDVGYIHVESGSSRTSVPGVFAAGDVADHVYRQAITAAGTGCMAAIDAERFLEAEESAARIAAAGGSVVGAAHHLRSAA